MQKIGNETKNTYIEIGIFVLPPTNYYQYNKFHYLRDHTLQHNC